MNIQAKVALDKERHPELFCRVHRCLWRVMVFPRPGIDAVADTRVRVPAPGCEGGFCPRHKHLAQTISITTAGLKALAE